MTSLDKFTLKKLTFQKVFTFFFFKKHLQNCIFSIFGPTTTFIHTKQNLVPYSQYEFRIVAKNTHGETKSSWSKQTTRQDSKYIVNKKQLIIHLNKT